MQNTKSNTKDREIFLSRTLNAPVALVWEMWTDPQHIANWWGPNGFTNTISIMDLKPGGQWNLVMHGPDGTDYDNKSIFKEIIRHKRIVFDHVSYPKITFTITFEARGDQTFLTWHMLFESAEVFLQVVKQHGAVEGMKQNVEKLEAYLAAAAAGTNPSQSPTPGKFAEINGIKMYYEIHGSVNPRGSGTPLVLLHGGGSTIYTTFGRILPVLARTHKVIAIELQAHGHTSDRDAPETFQQDADDIAELLKQLNLPAADIFGFSNGGQTAMELAIRHPEKVRRLIIASAFFKRSGTPAGFWAGFAKATLDNMPQLYRDEYLKINNDPAALLNMFNKDVQRMQNFTDWKDEDLISVQSPVLFVIGDQDLPLPENAVEMYRLLPHARLAILPGNHGSYLGEALTTNPNMKTVELLAAMIDEFLT
jgi:pimeloyl-ACP methyl ester carboxylesterase/uncharacterized protein YndB with AHSA1/START domain